MRAYFTLNPNCSEAVFRFQTVDPEQIRKIIQAFADATSPGYTVPKLNAPEDVNGVSFPACNHDGECIFEPELGSVVLRVGNNDLSKAACEFVESLRIVVEEAETSPDLEKKYARDCTCGNRYFDGYEKRRVTISANPLVQLSPKKE